jgi:hypothetical protein
MHTPELSTTMPQSDARVSDRAPGWGTDGVGAAGLLGAMGALGAEKPVFPVGGIASPPHPERLNVATITIRANLMSSSAEHFAPANVNAGRRRLAVS